MPQKDQISTQLRSTGARPESSIRQELAKDLSRGSWEKARIVLNAPLFEVAIDGMAGMHEACARASRRRAA